MNFEFLLPKYSVHTKLQINFQKIRTCFKCYKCTGYNRFLYRGGLTDKFQPNRFLFVGFYCTSFLIQLYLFHVLIWKINNRITLLIFLYNLLQNYIKSCTAILDQVMVLFLHFKVLCAILEDTFPHLDYTEQQVCHVLNLSWYVNFLKVPELL